jgi:hypothetical protein
MKLKIVCDSYNPYFVDICKYLHNCGFDIRYCFVDGYFQKESRSLFLNSQSPHIDDYIQISFCKIKNSYFDFKAKKNILVLNDHLSYKYSDYKDSLSRFDHIFVHNNYFKTIVSKLRIPKEKISVLNYYSKPLKTNVGKGSIFKIITDVENREWRLFLASYSRAYESYDDCLFSIETNSNINDFQLEVSNLFQINKLNMDAFDSVKITSSSHKGVSLDFNCYLSTGKHIIDENIYHCMGSRIPLIVFDSKFYNDLLRSNTCYYNKRNEKLVDSFISITEDIDHKNNIIDKAFQMSELFFSKDQFFKCLTSHLSEDKICEGIKPSSSFYVNGMDNIVI